MPWPGFEPGCLAALPPQDSVSTSFTTRAGPTTPNNGRKLESPPGGGNHARTREPDHARRSTSPAARRACVH